MTCIQSGAYHKCTKRAVPVHKEGPARYTKERRASTQGGAGHQYTNRSRPSVHKEKRAITTEEVAGQVH